MVINEEIQAHRLQAYWEGVGDAYRTIGQFKSAVIEFLTSTDTLARATPAALNGVKNARALHLAQTRAREKIDGLLLHLAGVDEKGRVKFQPDAGNTSKTCRYCLECYSEDDTLNNEDFGFSYGHLISCPNCNDRQTDSRPGFRAHHRLDDS